MNKIARTQIYLDTRYKSKKNLYPVKLRVTFNRKQKYYNTTFNYSKKEFLDIMSPNCNQTNKRKQSKLTDIQSVAIKIIDKLPDFTFERFEKMFKSPNGDPIINTFYESYIKKLISNDQISTANTYKVSLNSLLKFKNIEKIKFTDIDVDFLKKYEKWQISKGNSISTVGVHLRPLRTIFNIAIEDNILGEVYYPFKKNKYQIPKALNKKRAFSIDDIKKILFFESEIGSNIDRAKDIWTFSYLCNGMNMKDIFNLKYKNIDFKLKKIQFIRAKTANTHRQNITPIIIPLLNETLSIINKWGNYPQNTESYVFPVLEEGLSPEKQVSRIKQATKVINKYLDIIGKQLHLNIKLTTYTARHSYSTVQKRKGTSIEYISESLGHTSISTTQLYLDSFEDETRLEAAKKLLEFD